MRHPNPVLPRAGLLALVLALPLAACQQPAPEPPAEPPAPEQPAQPGQPAMEPVEAPPAEAMGATGGTDPAAGPDAEAFGGPVPTAPDESGAAFEDTRPGCDAAAVQSLIGEEATEALVERARSQSGANSVRVLKPGDAATMDYRGDRLNILTDDGGTVQSFNCG
jgi:hypothetical protein